MPAFLNRKEGGQLLSGRVAFRGYVRPVVLAASRGGVIIGYEVARALGAPLGLLASKTFAEDSPAAPRWSPELARRVLEPGHEPGSSPGGRCAEERRHTVFSGAACTCLHRGEGPPLEIRDRSVILVDDWIECGQAVLSVLPDLRRGRPRRIVLATPVAVLDCCPELEREVDELFWLRRPARGATREETYTALEPVTDATLIALLDRAALWSSRA
jgi:putative phosphoribosyl transferase